jgi:competence protein ComEA
MNKNWWLGAFIVLGALSGVGVLWLITRPPRGKPIELSPLPTLAPITVFVSGNVKQAGLYTLPYGSRVNDAIRAAGGFSADADNRAVNLAEPLADGEQLDVPAIHPSTGGGNPPGAVPGSSQLLDINSASLEALDTLPGIGPVTAQRIIDFRVANGPFKAIEDLLQVDGIGQATFDDIQNLITVETSP